MADNTHVGIVGGGIAGLTAATKLAEKGIKTTLLEAGSQLGGRARGVSVEFNDRVVQLDNGQHILLGAYQETLKLLKQVGINENDAFFRQPLALELFNTNKSTAFKYAAATYLPAPLNQLIGFLFCKGLSLSSRLSVIKLMIVLKNTNYQLNHDESLIDFLKNKKQSKQAITFLWEPLCLSALNTPINQASSKVFLNVLKDAFEGAPSNSDFLIPKYDLSHIFSRPMARYTQSRNGNTLINHRVKSISLDQAGYSVVTKKGELKFSHVIIATSTARLKNIVLALPKLNNIVNITQSYQYQPIYTIYLQYPNHIKLPKPMLGLTGTISQWIFDRGILCGQHGLMAVVISARGKHQKLTQEDLVVIVAQELHETFPILTKPLWHRVIAEKRATFSCDVNLPRPANSTLYPNLFIAGDYTYADYPATIESAVRSGIIAANMIKS
jgi:squalene-associated FAD-dependent desaturase